MFQSVGAGDNHQHGICCGNSIPVNTIKIRLSTDPIVRGKYLAHHHPVYLSQPGKRLLPTNSIPRILWIATFKLFQHTILQPAHILGNMNLGHRVKMAAGMHTADTMVLDTQPTSTGSPGGHLERDHTVGSWQVDRGTSDRFRDGQGQV